ncbi:MULTISPECIES: hypothetical protein [Corynebacterium]|uniref:Uncharacterized protein n=1 Tax=Corynebacterium aquatimens TaxID=1190508 RepID=A0A931GX88_9CORY|nr:MULTISPECIES: hypothetical protein [Corynebacterium]MBG6121064.1 hypothetical protein [Corynebacterium aquatimens]WJY66379.1 hypothetical protein CAQUA_08425 [Corynebacterium aquatimens]
MTSHHDNFWADEAAPDSFYALTPGGTAPYPATGSRLEVRDENFNLLSVHWSAAAALGETGERLARGERAAVYLARWDRIETDNDPLLKETS